MSGRAHNGNGNGHPAPADCNPCRSSVEIRLPGNWEDLTPLRDRFDALAAQSGLTPESALDLRQAVMEMVANALEWGSRRRAELHVWVVFEIFRDRVEVHVCDGGPGFDPEALPHAASTDAPAAHLAVREFLGLRPGGYGILMARGLVDRLEYNPAGNRCTLVKYYDTPSCTALLESGAPLAPAL
jgi:anti-sigma regulatory factor (Ser/Thr protein kinase)